MGLLTKKLDSYLGIDIGGQTIKLVEFYNDGGRPKLRTYGIAEVELAFGKKETDESPERIAKVIRQLHKKTKAASDMVVTSLPTFDVFTSIVNIPSMPKKEMAAAVAWEAKKLIPMPLEQMTWYWEELKVEVGEDEDKDREKDKEKRPREGEVIKIKKQSKKNIHVLIVAVPSSLGAKYIEIMKNAGLNLLDMEPEVFALIRSLVGRDKSLVMLVEIGAMNTNVSIVDQGVPILSRGVDAGGVNITRLMETKMGIDAKRAEQVKKDLADYLVFKQVKNEIPEDFKIAVSPIVNEIKYIFSLVGGQASSLTLTPGNNGKIDRIILTGGSALLPYLSSHLSSVVDTKVYVGDPWARVDYPDDLKYLLEDVGPHLAIAAGLAMRRIIK